MRRGYSKEAFLSLVTQARQVIGPHVTLSTDVITGFCGETEEDHQETVAVMKEVGFDQAFMFYYSMREGTHAHRRLQDDVPVSVKKRRLEEVIATFREEAKKKNEEEVRDARQHLVLVEGYSKRRKKRSKRGEGGEDDRDHQGGQKKKEDEGESAEEMTFELTGRTDSNKRVMIPDVPVRVVGQRNRSRHLRPGDYVVVKVVGAGVSTLQTIPLRITSLQSFYGVSSDGDDDDDDDGEKEEMV